MIENIIEDLVKASHDTPFQLYMRLIGERLDKSLSSYYHDLTLQSNYVENVAAEKDILKVVKKVIR